ncbi:hypothetical protein HDU83_002643, partial [Entophlyctis luteolus]
MDSNQGWTFAGVFGVCALLAAGVLAAYHSGARRRQDPITAVVQQQPLHTVIQMTEVPALPAMVKLNHSNRCSPTSAKSVGAESDATSATSINSDHIGTPYTTLPMGGFHRDSLKPMAEVQSTDGGYVIQEVPQNQNESNKKMLAFLVRNHRMSAPTGSSNSDDIMRHIIRDIVSQATAVLKTRRVQEPSGSPIDNVTSPDTQSPVPQAAHMFASGIKSHVPFYAVSDTLAAFFVRAVVLDPRNEFHVEKELSKSDVERLIS